MIHCSRGLSEAEEEAVRVLGGSGCQRRRKIGKDKPLQWNVNVVEKVE